MVECKPPKRTILVVRFLGYPGQDRQAWRGEVEHVQSGEKRSFQGAPQFLRILEDLSGQAKRENTVIRDVKG